MCWFVVFGGLGTEAGHKSQQKADKCEVTTGLVILCKVCKVYCLHLDSIPMFPGI